MSDGEASTVGSSDPGGREVLGPDCRASQSGRAPLSRNRIVDAAMCYVDANCLDDLSMRRLGGELGVEAMSLYRYFPSKAALLDGVVCHALDLLELPASNPTEDWERDVRAYARSFRQLARQHPRLMPLLATMGPQNHTLADVTDRMVGLAPASTRPPPSVPRPRSRTTSPAAASGTPPPGAQRRRLRVRS